MYQSFIVVETEREKKEERKKSQKGRAFELETGENTYAYVGNIQSGSW